MNKKSVSTLLLILLAQFIIVFVFFTYTFLHECRHALAGVLFGQTVTAFDVNIISFNLLKD